MDLLIRVRSRQENAVTHFKTTRALKRLKRCTNDMMVIRDVRWSRVNTHLLYVRITQGCIIELGEMDIIHDLCVSTFLIIQSFIYCLRSFYLNIVVFKFVD